MKQPKPLRVVGNGFSDLRREYRHVALHEEDVCDDPIEQFQDWFRQAVELDVPLPNAMTLATATKDGKPTARYVLLKDVSEKGFSFYTHDPLPNLVPRTI